ncbi:Inhibitor of growth protein 2 [Lamellibrachia satsuma]|nr:Inhibitor of growth protein 2 [Lamellibrachia satsuma]
MSMLNQAAVEALCSATYLESYLDCTENLPDDLQRIVTHLRELDFQTNELLKDIRHHQEVYLKEGDSNQKKRSLIQIQRGLIKSQEIGDEKLQLVTQIIELIENRTRQLEQDLENLDPGTTQVSKTEEESKSATPSSTKVTSKVEDVADANKTKRQRRQRSSTTEQTVKEEEKKQEEEERPKKKKKRKANKKEHHAKDKSPVDPPIDPDEPTYCLCQQVSYGEMIGCDNDACSIEWFHFNCVGLTSKPKGKWFCPKCRGDKPNIKRTDLK